LAVAEDLDFGAVGDHSLGQAAEVLQRLEEGKEEGQGQQVNTEQRTG
jgi:hypothetical protein